jgi:hypothetical protein
MTILHCNHDASGNYDVLTTEHAASSWHLPILIHRGKALAPNDLYDEGMFGSKPARDVEICTRALLDEEQVIMLNRWHNACEQAHSNQSRGRKIR